MRFTSLIALAVVLTLGACTNHEAKKAVKQLLNDPDSAQFRDITPGKEEKSVCGFVNAKNRMGGYVGDSPFFYQGLSQTVGIANSPTDSDIRSLALSLKIGGRSFDEEFQKVTMMCEMRDRWDDVCSLPHPTPKHEVCALLNSPTDLVRVLNNRY